ncbi:hypothetical protein CAS74_001924 [Pichia kudriavzevii]|uniref:Cyclin N-terminal domain-containing protein n=1 Tax=Pichia kudriavzevii TaxID=4909 RepID=A0A1Z8JSL2_PICKU|nr:hypothetical protein CAS74_001924 [Pichia kudriavzevii]
MTDAQAMHIFSQSPVTQDMIHHLVSVTLQVLPCENAKTVTETIVTKDGETVTRTKPLPSLMTFITKLVRYTNVYTATLMSTIVYMNRLKEKLPQEAKGLPCTRHRIFLACLILCSKNFNDSSPKNKHWAKYTDGLFRREDVNLMERQLLMLLDWDLQITNAELALVWKRFLDPIKADLKKNSRIRKSLSKGMLTESDISAVDQQETQHSRTSSVSSSIYSVHSRASSVSSIGSYNNHYSKPSITPSSSNENIKQALDSLSANTPLSNYLKSVAMKEEQELNNLIREYCGY